MLGRFQLFQRFSDSFFGRQNLSLSVLVATERFGSFRTLPSKAWGGPQCSVALWVRRFSRRQSNNRRGVIRTRSVRFATLAEGVWIVPERPCQQSWRWNAQARYHIVGPTTSQRRKEEHSDDALLRPGHVIAA